jgi:hypothetical protein
MAQSGLKWATPAIKPKYHETSGSKIIFKELCFPPFVFPHHLLSLPAYTNALNQPFSLVISLVIPVIFDHQLDQPLPRQIPSFPISS